MTRQNSTPELRNRQNDSRPNGSRQTDTIPQQVREVYLLLYAKPGIRSPVRDCLDLRYDSKCITIVVSSLLSLMKDQVANFGRRGVKCVLVEAKDRQGKLQS